MYTLKVYNMRFNAWNIIAQRRLASRPKRNCTCKYSWAMRKDRSGEPNSITFD